LRKLFEVRAGFRTGIGIKPILPARTPNQASMEFKSLTSLQTVTRQVGSWTSFGQRAKCESEGERVSQIRKPIMITQTRKYHTGGNSGYRQRKKRT
jgi:hypothetical protein